MKPSLFFALSCLSTAVWAGGYQGCLERVLLFQAYEIDELNDEKDRTIGYKCTKWNDPLKKCDGTWTPCRPKRKGATRCNYDELVVHLGKTNVAKGWSVYDDKGKLDVDKTALATYRLYEARPKPPTAALIPNFPPFVAIKDGGEWNDYIDKLNQKVNDTWKSKMTAENKHLWEAFDGTNERIRIARAGDHGKYLSEAAEKKLKGIEIRKQKLGTNPVTGGDWETVDWNETAKQAVASGMTRADVNPKIKEFLFTFYRGKDADKQAKEHYQVIKSYKKMANATVKCRKG
jgi:hypothetical protein